MTKSSMTVAVLNVNLGIGIGWAILAEEMWYGGALVVAVTLSQLVRGRQEQQF